MGSAVGWYGLVMCGISPTRSLLLPVCQLSRGLGCARHAWNAHTTTASRTLYSVTPPSIRRCVMTRPHLRLSYQLAPWGDEHRAQCEWWAPGESSHPTN